MFNAIPQEPTDVGLLIRRSENVQNTDDKSRADEDHAEYEDPAGAQAPPGEQPAFHRERRRGSASGLAQRRDRPLNSHRSADARDRRRSDASEWHAFLLASLERGCCYRLEQQHTRQRNDGDT